MLSIKCSLCALVVLLCMSFAASVHANSVVGPHLTHSGAGTSAYRDEDGSKLGNVSKRRTDLRLLIPTPPLSANLQLVPQVQLSSETRIFSENIRPMQRHGRMLAAGVIAAWQNANKDLQLFMIPSRYARAADDGGAPMTEIIFGFSSIDERVPGVFRGAELLAALRYRRFPHAERWLPLLGYKQRLGPWFYEILVPAHVHLSYDLDGGSNYLQAIAALDGRQESYELSGRSHWAEGYATNLHLSWLRHLHDIAYLRVDAGVQREFLEIYDASGAKSAIYNFDFAPFVQIGVYTHVAEDKL